MNECRQPYLKRPLTAAEHIALLSERGLGIPNPDRAAHYLSFIGYFRLSGYFPPFLVADSSAVAFKPGTTFSDVLDRYIFDRKLRMLLVDPLERIEVAVRTVLSNEMSLSHGPFWPTDARLFDEGKLEEVLKTIRGATDLKDGKTHHDFLKHYATRYQDETPPSWMIFETLSFGSVSHIFRRLRREHQKKVASCFQLDPKIFQSWLHALSFTRNLVAHHDRIWNRAFVIQPRIPHKLQAYWPEAGAKRVYGICVIINFLMEVIADGSRWPDRLRALLSEYPEVPKAAMGFPEEWTEMTFWRNRFSVTDGEAVLCPVSHHLCVAVPTD